MSSIWPDKQPPEYAEQSLKMLCTVFRVPYNAQSKTAYRDFKDSNGLAVTDPMQRFIFYFLHYFSFLGRALD